MGLFDSIRRVVGGGQSAADDGGSDADRPDLVDTNGLDAATLRDRAAGVAGEVEQLDFSLESLSQFDAAIDEGYDEELATAADPDTYATDAVRFGCYLGEVLCRAYGGEWTRDPGWVVTVSGPDGHTTVDVFAVAERSITTGAVFAAVADRAATEAGLDGRRAADADGEADDDRRAVPGGDEGTAVDEPEPAADTPPDDLGDARATPADDEPAAAGAPASGTGDEPADPGSEDGVASLIDEAEPDTTAPSTVDADSTTAAADADADASEDAIPDSDGPSADTRGSLFADDPAADPDDAPTADADESTADATTADESEPDPTAADGLRETYAEAAAELVSFWGEYDLDYTPASLQRLDALVSAEWDDDRFDDAAFGDDDSFDDRVFTSVSTELGSYFGEVLVRDLDAEWSDETATDSVVVESAEGPLAIPVFKVAGTSIKQQPVFARSYDSLLEDIEAAE